MYDTNPWVSNKGDLLAELKTHVEAKTQLADYKFASAVEQNALVYDCEKLRPIIATHEGRRDVMAELGRALLSGPGILAFKKCTQIRQSLIASQNFLADHRRTTRSR